ncbi:MAG: DUF4230 domain-containing protein [Verrucomicrobiota bacterium]
MNGRELWKVLAFLAILIAAVFLAREAILAPVRLTEKVAQGIDQKLRETGQALQSILQIQPQIIVESVTIQEQVSPIAEFAAAERELNATYKWRQLWLGSEKTIQVKGKFLAKAGFNLKKEVAISYDEATGEVVITLPRAELLSVEALGQVQYIDDDGWWNKVRDQERTAALNAFQALAVQKARESDLLAEAERFVEGELKLILPDDHQYRVEYSLGLDTPVLD